MKWFKHQTAARKDERIAHVEQAIGTGLGGGKVIQWMRDVILELRIDSAMRRMMSASSVPESRFHAVVMAGLIRQRSPQQVARMEKKMRIA